MYTVSTELANLLNRTERHPVLVTESGGSRIPAKETIPYIGFKIIDDTLQKPAYLYHPGNKEYYVFYSEPYDPVIQPQFARLKMMKSILQGKFFSGNSTIADAAQNVNYMLSLMAMTDSFGAVVGIGNHTSFYQTNLTLYKIDPNTLSVLNQVDIGINQSGYLYQYPSLMVGSSFYTLAYARTLPGITTELVLRTSSDCITWPSVETTIVGNTVFNLPKQYPHIFTVPDDGTIYLSFSAPSPTGATNIYTSTSIGGTYLFSTPVKRTFRTSSSDYVEGAHLGIRAVGSTLFCAYTNVQSYKKFDYSYWVTPVHSQSYFYNNKFFYGSDGYGVDVYDLITDKVIHIGSPGSFLTIKTSSIRDFNADSNGNFLYVGYRPFDNTGEYGIDGHVFLTQCDLIGQTTTNFIARQFPGAPIPNASGMPTRLTYSVGNVEEAFFIINDNGNLFLLILQGTIPVPIPNLPSQNWYDAFIYYGSISIVSGQLTYTPKWEFSQRSYWCGGRSPCNKLGSIASWAIDNRHIAIDLPNREILINANSYYLPLGINGPTSKWQTLIINIDTGLVRTVLYGGFTPPDYLNLGYQGVTNDAFAKFGDTVYYSTDAQVGSNPPGLHILNLSTGNITHRTESPLQNGAIVKLYVEPINFKLWIGKGSIGGISDTVISMDMTTGALERMFPITEPAFESTASFSSVHQLLSVPAAGVGIACRQFDTFLFSLGGYNRYIKYIAGAVAGTNWAPGSESQFVVGSRENEIDFSQNQYGLFSGIWRRKVSLTSDSLRRSIRFFEENTDLLLPDKLVDEIRIENTLELRPNTLTMNLSEGYLYDSTNLGAIWQNRVPYGASVNINKSEFKIDGTYSLPAATIFYGNIYEKRIDYTKPSDLHIQLEAQDKRRAWQDKFVTSKFYNNIVGYTVLTDLLWTYMGHTSASVTVSSLTGFSKNIYSDTLKTQFIEQRFIDIIGMLLIRWGLIGYLDSNNTFKVRSGPVIGVAPDIIYSDTKSLISLNPDISNSDLVNRITVIGREKEKTTLYHPDQVLSTVSGTRGWWSKTRIEKVYFSSDQQQKAVNVRLIHRKTTVSWWQSFFSLFRIKERIVNIFPTYVEVEIDVVFLVIALYALAGNIIAASQLPQGAAFIVMGVLINMAILMLTQVAEFIIDIAGQPITEVQKEVSYYVDDLEHQQQIGKVVEERVEHPLCYSTMDCQNVANFLLYMRKLKRMNVRFVQPSDLRLEPGDQIRIVHPTSGMSTDLYTWRTEKTLKKASPGSNDGTDTDSVDAYVVS